MLHRHYHSKHTQESFFHQQLCLLLVDETCVVTFAMNYFTEPELIQSEFNLNNRYWLIPISSELP